MQHCLVLEGSAVDPRDSGQQDQSKLYKEVERSWGSTSCFYSNLVFLKPLMKDYTIGMSRMKDNDTGHRGDRRVLILRSQRSHISTEVRCCALQGWHVLTKLG